MKTVFQSVLLGGTVLSLLTTPILADTLIVERGKSTFTIVLPADAPASVRAAATELQGDIQKSTGAALPVAEDTAAIAGPVISLGQTRQAKAAAILPAGIAPEGFRIQTRNGNLYILGPDTATREDREKFPHSAYPQFTENGGTSNGTANGVYSFLEDYLGVRWLMPGEIGRDVPRQSTLTIPDIARQEAPGLINRRMPYVQKTAAVSEWQNHLKLGFSFRINHQHNWMHTVPAELFDEHPDWFAMVNGKRQPPGHRYKLETTNPEVVKYYAEKAIAALRANPSQNTYSLSPTDGRGWSESPASKALYDPPPPGSKFPSITPLILKWYRDVSEIVAREYPAGKLAGYIYTDFSRPPQKGGMTLPENFIPVIVGQGFGYRFYRQDARELGAQLIRDWEKVAPSTWFYYGMPIWLRSSTGMLTTAAPDNLNFLFALLRENHIRGAYLYGNTSWSQAAMGNYMQAKMMWNPALDANELQHEWLMRAYGPAAGAVMEQLYREMDSGAFAEYFRQEPSQHYNTREKMYKEYYAPHYAQIEKLFLKAKSQPLTAPQRARLQLIEDNLIVLQWRLRNAGYLYDNFDSPLRRTDAEVVQLLLAKHDDFERFPGIIAETGISPVEVSLQAPPAAKSKEVPNKNSVLLYAARSGEVRLKGLNVHPGSAFLGYTITENSPKAPLVRSGILYGGEEIVFPARANTAYYFTVTASTIVGPISTWDLFVSGAAPAQASFRDGTLYLEGPPARLYVYAPPGLSLASRADAAGVTLLSKTSLAEALRRYPNAKPILNLDEDWRFQTDPQKAGLKQNFADPGFNDQEWKSVTATAYWQDQGFDDYHGTAWYRKTFTAPPLTEDDPLGVDVQHILLYFGGVDGDATVYLNGQKIGEHLPSQLGRGWDQPFILDATAALKPGRNTIAVQVTKDRYKSGMNKGVTLMLAEKAAK